MSLSRQIINVSSNGTEILNENGVLVNGNFYELLPEYISNYEELRNHLIDHYKENQMVNERALSLPDIDFIDYSNPYGVGAMVAQVLTVLFFPVGLFYLFMKNRYVSKVKDSIRETNRLLGSIQMLTKDM